MRVSNKEQINKVTIVSTLPFVLTERKPGQIPHYYEIAAAPTRETLGITHVGDAWFPELIPFTDDKAPARRVHIPAEGVAEGICTDYIGASLAAQFDPLDNGAMRLPGIFWVHGVLTGSQVLEIEPFKVKQAKLNTIAWFEALVKLADDAWQKFHQHIMITDLQRRAASYLGFKDREWNVNVIEALAAQASCPSCMSAVNKGAIICFNCKYILDKVKYEANKGNFATA
jgi:hypothetical protein